MPLVLRLGCGLATILDATPLGPKFCPIITYLHYQKPSGVPEFYGWGLAVR
jgi:hypothetical protein